MKDRVAVAMETLVFKALKLELPLAGKVLDAAFTKNQQKHTPYIPEN